jgi:outer membrane protein assembly factor BamB
MRIARTLLISSAAVVAGTALFAQGRNIGNEWPTALADAQRTNWLRSDPNISIETLAKPGFELQWRAGLEGQRGLKPAVQGVTANGVTLFTPLSIVTGANDAIAIDNDTGETFWYKSFGAAPAASGACAAAPVAATRQAPLVPAVPTVAGAGGRGGRGGYSSAVGTPGEGAPIPAGAGRGGAPAAGGGRGAGAPPAGAPPAGAPPAGAPPAGAPPVAGAPQGQPAPPGAPPAAGRGGGGGGGFGRPSGVVYALGRDGMLYGVALASAKDTYKPAPFIPAGARATDLLAVNDMLYTSTTGRCGGSTDAVYAMDLASQARPVVSYETTGSPVGVVAVTTDGRVVVVLTNGVVTLDPKTLAVKQSFTDKAMTFATGPLVFVQGGRDMIAAGTSDGRIVVFDTTLSAPIAAVKLATDAGATFGADALAFFREYSAPPPDAAAAQAAAQPPAAGRGFGAGAAGIPMVPGPAWLLATTKAAIVAFKIEPGEKPSLTPAWTSRTLASPAAPLVVNNVVFAVSSGKPAASSGAGSAAVLYALDALTGKEIWSSGTTLKSYMPGRALWASNSQVYVGGNDGAVYAFGFALERK